MRTLTAWATGGMLLAILWVILHAVFGPADGPNPRFIVSRGGEVLDRRTGLEWVMGPDRSFTWKEAAAWAKKSAATGIGWRMPDKAELKTLRTFNDGVRLIQPVFTNNGFWAWAGDDENARWTYGFSYGGEGWPGQAPPNGGRAFAVRNVAH